MTEEQPFDISDIEDVRIIIKAKGKHWALIPKSVDFKDRAKEVRIAVAVLCLDNHYIVDKPLEYL